ncbi:hypothetical protein D3C78_1831880 [compost metagenome]
MQGFRELFGHAALIDLELLRDDLLDHLVVADDQLQIGAGGAVQTFEKGGVQRAGGAHGQVV